MSSVISSKLTMNDFQSDIPFVLPELPEFYSMDWYLSAK